MYHPRHYDDPIAEYWKLVNDVTLWDVGVERQVEITGPDAAAFTDLLTPRDLTRCAVGQCKFVLITDADGGILNNPVLLRLDEQRFWLSVADGDVLLWAKGVASHAGYDVEIREPDVAPVQVQGPRSGDVMVDLFGERILDLRYYWHDRFSLDGLDVIVSRTGYTGELGYEIYLFDASRRGQQLWDRVLDAGRPYDIAPIGPCQIRRVEAGILSYGSDITVDTHVNGRYEFLNPYEAGLEWTVDLEQPAEFIGQDALRRVAREGPQRRVVGVELDGDPLIGYLEDYAPVLVGEQRVGHISSAFWSPRLERNVGFALVPAAHAAVGTDLTVRLRGLAVPARVVPKPFIDPRKEIPKRDPKARVSAA
jgi:glycine cleavage system aminomethyltransferase T